ncbi:hypothetical protein [Frankia sp. QA3]|uniref:hypothetical protein n=1 Tax=Frankia sp. QA3 TaxID=710111 RepID=UPI000269B662|nr:hypothetical protein [Frankia sp. QA3]EIV90793.1 hypothetical protein FraQA3DRAFT_0196 [Frankia sp. QA3]
MIIVVGILAALAALVTVALIRDVKLAVAAWLRDRGLAASALMNVLIRLDKVGSRVRASLRIKARRQPRATVVLDETYSMKQIKDSGLLSELNRRGHAQVLDLLDLA